MRPVCRFLSYFDAMNLIDVPVSILKLSFVQGAYFAWKATALGKNYVNGKTFLEKR